MMDDDWQPVNRREMARWGHGLLWAICASIVAFILWAHFATLDEVAVGEGTVTPSMRSQIIQTLEGGIMTELFVHEGDIVDAGQRLATLNPVQARSSYEEADSKIQALVARQARLQAEINQLPEVLFPEEVAGNTLLINGEKQLFSANRAAWKNNVSNLTRELQLVRRELDMTAPLVHNGAANQVEVLRLQQREAEINTRLQTAKNDYFVHLKDDLTRTRSELAPLIKIRDGRGDQLTRTTLVSPARGVVKDIRTSTVGGVLSPGGELMEIVPLDDQLLIESHISPRDIAFIHPGLPANVKITAYDSSIYGSMPGRVERISPDTIQDEIDRRQRYYRVYVITDRAWLETPNGKRLPIVPGMVATSEIRTGKKTVMDYLIKPLNRAAEALRER